MIYRDKDWLKEQYIDLKRSGLDIAGECGVCKRTIYLWLEKYGIERRKCYEYELPELYLYVYVHSRMLDTGYCHRRCL